MLQTITKNIIRDYIEPTPLPVPDAPTVNGPNGTEVSTSPVLISSNFAISNGEKVIQFRNDNDRTNLSNVGTAALALIVGGNPTQLMEWRTLDNVTQLVPAVQMVQISNGVLAVKQQIVSKAWEHKDTLRSMTITNDVVAYDITAGW